MQVLKGTNRIVNFNPVVANTAGFYPRKLAIATVEGIRILRWSDIKYCNADGNYCRIHCSDGSFILVSKTLKTIAQALPDSWFIRIHQSHLVAIEKIRIIKQDEVLMEDGTKFPLARARRSRLIEQVQTTSVLV